MGDSFTFGTDVSDTEIINLGVNGYGHDQMLIYLLEEGLKYHPDIILIGLGTWDRERNLHEFFFAAKPKFSWSSNQLVLCNSPVPSPEWFLKHEFWRPKFFDLIEVLRFQFLSKIGVIDREGE